MNADKRRGLSWPVRVLVLLWMPFWFLGMAQLDPPGSMLRKIVLIGVMESTGIAIVGWILFPDAFHWVLRGFGACLFAVGFWAVLHAFGASAVINALLLGAAAAFLLRLAWGHAGVRWMAAIFLFLLALGEFADLAFHVRDAWRGGLGVDGTPPSPWAVLAGFCSLSVPGLLLSLGWDHPHTKIQGG